MKQLFITLFIMLCALPTMQAQTAADYQTAAENGDAEAQNELGVCYYYGRRGVEKDYQQAVYWYQKAAEQGYVYSQN